MRTQTSSIRCSSRYLRNTGQGGMQTAPRTVVLISGPRVSDHERTALHLFTRDPCGCQEKTQAPALEGGAPRQPWPRFRLCLIHRYGSGADAPTAAAVNRHQPGLAEPCPCLNMAEWHKAKRCQCLIAAGTGEAYCWPRLTLRPTCNPGRTTSMNEPLILEIFSDYV